jgi:hypothetical protein
MLREPKDSDVRSHKAGGSKESLELFGHSLKRLNLEPLYAQNFRSFDGALEELTPDAFSKPHARYREFINRGCAASDFEERAVRQTDHANHFVECVCGNQNLHLWVADDPIEGLPVGVRSRFIENSDNALGVSAPRWAYLKTRTLRLGGTHVESRSLGGARAFTKKPAKRA